MYLILILCITFCYNVICVNNNVCGGLCVPYKYKRNVFVGSQIVAQTQVETGDGPNKPNTINL